jgi:hypothetical protein
MKKRELRQRIALLEDELRKRVRPGELVDSTGLPVLNDGCMVAGFALNAAKEGDEVRFMAVQHGIEVVFDLADWKGFVGSEKAGK